MDVLFDTSFLVTAMENRLDLMMELRKFGRPRLFVLDKVMQELEKLAEGRGKDGMNARLSLEFLKREQAKVVRSHGGNTDNRILEYSMNRNMAVCAIDRELKERLSKGGIEVITIRQGRYLALADTL